MYLNDDYLSLYLKKPNDAISGFFFQGNISCVFLPLIFCIINGSLWKILQFYQNLFVKSYKY